MKFFKKSVQIILIVIINAVLILSGCSRGEGIDKTKTQLYIGNYDGGIGHEWLNKIKAKFEAQYSDYSFQPGKKGVQVKIDNDKSPYLGPNLLATINVEKEEIIFSEYVVNLSDFVSAGKLKPITEVVKSVPDGDSVTIESRLSEEQKDYLNTAGEYYALPHYKTYFGITYDIDLFDRYRLYFAEDGYGDERGFARINDVIYDDSGKIEKRSASSKLSKGPDGISFTDDDGLPSTYEEFFALCDKMRNLNINPISWTGKYDYLIDFMVSLWADYEGADQMSLNVNFKGYAKSIVDSINANGEVSFKAETEITPSNGYLLSAQAGRYYALSFVERLAKKGYQTPLSTNLTQDHLAAQRDYIYSDFENKPIAMLVEGTWWENEAKNAFDDCVAEYGQGANSLNRRFGIMPLPKVNKNKAGKQTIFDSSASYMLVSAAASDEKTDLIEKFISMCYSEKNLIEFTEVTGSVKNLNYDLSKVNSVNLSHYAKSVINLMDVSENFYPFSTERLYLYNQVDFNIRKGWYATIDEKPYNKPFDVFRNTSITPKQYFEGMLINEATWLTKYNEYFN